MFSEYFEANKPIDDMVKKWEESEKNNKSNVDNSDKKEKKEKKEQEGQVEECKAKINEWYNVLSNWYPQWFQKTLSNVEKDGKEVSNILNINFWENENWERHLSLSISEQEKQEWKESNTTSNITWEFSNFQEKNSKDNDAQNGRNNQDNDQNIFPQINISKFWNNQDLLRILSQLLQWTGTENESQNNIQNTEYLLNWAELQQPNSVQELIWFIDKNIMRSPINGIYWYVQRNQLKQREEQSNEIDNFRTFLCELQFTPKKGNEEILKYIENPENFNNNESIQEYRDIVAALCVLCRNNTISGIIDLLGISEEEQKERLKEPSLATWDFVVEYLYRLKDSEISLIIQNKDQIVKLSKQEE